MNSKKGEEHFPDFTNLPVLLEKPVWDTHDNGEGGSYGTGKPLNESARRLDQVNNWLARQKNALKEAREKRFEEGFQSRIASKPAAWAEFSRQYQATLPNQNRESGNWIWPGICERKQERHLEFSELYTTERLLEVFKTLELGLVNGVKFNELLYGALTPQTCLELLMRTPHEELAALQVSYQERLKQRVTLFQSYIATFAPLPEEAQAKLDAAQADLEHSVKGHLSYFHQQLQ